MGFRRQCANKRCAGFAVVRGYCNECARPNDYDKTRPNAARRGYGGQWRRYRKSFLMENPLCACGCGQPATDVDHIQPVTGPNDPLFWSRDNHQALSHECHSRKTAREQNGKAIGL